MNIFRRIKLFFKKKFGAYFPYQVIRRPLYETIDYLPVSASHADPKEWAHVHTSSDNFVLYQRRLLVRAEQDDPFIANTFIKTDFIAYPTEELCEIWGKVKLVEKFFVPKTMLLDEMFFTSRQNTVIDKITFYPELLPESKWRLV